MLSAIFAFVVRLSQADAPSHMEFRMMTILNEIRARGHTCENGQEFAPNPIPLKWDCALWRASRAHNLDMTENDFFAHEGSDGSMPGDRVRRFGLDGFLNENIGSGRDNPEEQIESWLGSWFGHCQGMLNPAARTFGADYQFDPTTSFWSYWTLTVAAAEPNEALQDCGLVDGVLPPPLPTPPPSPFPTLAGRHVAEVDQLMDFQPTSWEMEVMRLLNEERARGNTEECSGEFHSNLPPLVWNCGAFRAVRHAVWDCKKNEIWSRTGSDGKKIKDRLHDYKTSSSCSDFLFTGREYDDYWMRPAQLVDRLKRLACWAVYGPEYKSFGSAYAAFKTRDGDFPYSAWWVAFNRQMPQEEVQTCGGGDAPVPSPSPMPMFPVPAPSPAPTEPVPEPTPAPSEPLPEPTPAPTELMTLPTPAPVEQPVAEPTEAPAPLSCADYGEKKPCKKQDNCCWKKNTCKDKVKICPKQGTLDKCDKFGCTWDADAEACDWIEI